MNDFIAGMAVYFQNLQRQITELYSGGNMQGSFTLHCVPWRVHAPMLEDIRASACRMGLLTQAEAQTDRADESCQHALILSQVGQALGCARITRQGNAECLAILALENRAELESALRLAAWLNEPKF